MITVVVSSFNEEKNLPFTVYNLISSAKAAGDVPLDIIIVNDGSHDRTGDVIRELEAKHSFIRSIHYAQNRGIGAGVLDAMEIAKYEKMCFFPGDNACSPYVMMSLFKNADKADFLISLIVNTEERGFKRKIVSALYSFIYILTFSLPIRYVNGSPLFPVSFAKTLHLKSKRYSILGEITVKILKKNISFLEIPDYIKPNQTKTSAIRWVNIKEVVATYLRLVYEIYFLHKSEFNSSAIRILPNIELYPSQETMIKGREVLSSLNISENEDQKMELCKSFS